MENVTDLRVPYFAHDAIPLLSRAIAKKFLMRYPYSEIVILCIGTDRSTGDALGPLIGSKLLSLPALPVKVYGHLEEPVHAVNLIETIDHINRNHSESTILAIDASLGRLKSVGTIQLQDGPLKPGSGVKKELPAVGHFHITGVVNVGGFMEYLVLQNTRLSLVMNMADVISSSIVQAVMLIQKAEAKFTAPAKAQAIDWEYTEWR